MPQKNNCVYEISILGRIIWNLHSLNNEGTIGNITEPRVVRVVDPNTKEVITTDGISGEMLKHIHFEFLWELTDKNNLCEGCKKMEPERSYKDDSIKEKGNIEEVLTKIIKKCLICDLHGFLFPEREIGVSRESLIHFGWVVGKGATVKDLHTHTRQAIGERQSTEDKESPQMIYHRPTRSGVYALVSVFQPWRIGLNNINMKYVKEVNRKERYKLALKAYQAMFLRTEGAMTTTRLPHAEGFEGLIIVSKTNFPTPVISPLSDSYESEIKEINKKLGNVFDVYEFQNLAEFVEKINLLMEMEPYSVNF